MDRDLAIANEIDLLLYSARNLVDFADDTGCSENLTVCYKAHVDKLAKMADRLEAFTRLWIRSEDESDTDSDTGGVHGSL